MTMSSTLGPNGYEVAMTSGNALEMSSAQVDAVQALVSEDGMRVITDRVLNECILLGNNAQLYIPPGRTIVNGGAVQHTMIRTGNAEFSAVATPIPGISIYCADEQAAGTGTLRYTHSGTTLAWQAPGETAFGSEINIGSVSDVATINIFAVPAASAGKTIYVFVAPAAGRNTNLSRVVRVEAVTGARAMTWTRASNVRTVAETAHGRRVGDFVINFGPSGDVSHGYITAVTADTYTLPDTGADQGAAQVGRAYGVRNVRIMGNGATLDYNKPNLTTALTSNLQAILLLAVSDCLVDAPSIINCTKYGVLVVGYTEVVLNGVSGWRTSSADLSGNSDTVHVCGPGRDITINNTRSQGGDNIVGVGCCDYVDYQMNLPSAGDLSLNGGRVIGTRGEDTHQQPVRFYNAANANFIRRWVVDTVTGTFNTDCDSAVAVIAEENALQVEPGVTNVDGLTIISPDAVRTDGSASYGVKMTGAGARSGIRMLRVRPRAGTSTFRATIWIGAGTTTADLLAEFEPGNFSGYLVGLTGTANVGRLSVRATGQINGNNELGAGHAPAIVALDSSTSVISSLDVEGVIADDTSSTGTKLRGLFNNGTVTFQSWTDVRLLDGDALIRHASTAATGTVKARNCDAATAFGMVFDGGCPTDFDLSGFRHTVASNALLQNNDATARTIRVRAVNCVASNRFLRNVQGNHTWLISGHGNTPGSAASIITDAGAPVWRLDGDWDMPIDGALLDSTVANHRAGARFYNTNAAFGAPGVGAYVRGATAWVRVAA